MPTGCSGKRPETRCARATLASGTYSDCPSGSALVTLKSAISLIMCAVLAQEDNEQQLYYTCSRTHNHKVLGQGDSPLFKGCTHQYRTNGSLCGTLLATGVARSTHWDQRAIRKHLHRYHNVALGPHTIDVEYQDTYIATEARSAWVGVGHARSVLVNVWRQLASAGSHETRTGTLGSARATVPAVVLRCRTRAGTK